MDHCIASSLVSFVARQVSGSLGVSGRILSGRVALPQLVTSSVRHSYIVQDALCRNNQQTSGHSLRGTVTIVQHTRIEKNHVLLLQQRRPQRTINLCLCDLVINMRIISH